VHRHPQEPVHRRMSWWEADGTGIVGEVLESNRVGIIDQRTEEAPALGKVADGRHLLGRHPDVDECLETAMLGNDTECAVPGIHELDGRLHDSLQHDPEVQWLHDGLRGAQQGPEPLLRPHDLAGAVRQSVERAIQFGTGCTGDGS
jgi:hypothetical protein